MAEKDRDTAPLNGSDALDKTSLPLPESVMDAVEQDAAQSGGAFQPRPEDEGCIGWTMFDSPQAKDGAVVGLLPREQVGHVPNRALVRILSVDDKRQYLGIIQEGPFAEPDGLRADAPVVVTTTVRGRIFMPRYHGRLHIELLGEETEGGLVPPRFRPFPNSPVFLLDETETAAVLHSGGDLSMGRAIGYDALTVGAPAAKKSVLPRHTGILGTTGSGKSTSVARLIQQAQAADFAVVLLDVEGEYTEINRPTADPVMLNALRLRGLAPQGVPNTHLYHLVGTETTNPQHPARTEFSLPFSRLSPYAVTEILGLNDAQEVRYWQAYEVTKQILGELGIFPKRAGSRIDSDDERHVLELNEFETGYPEMTLSILIDIVNLCLHVASKEEGDPTPYNKPLQSRIQDLKKRVHAMHLDHPESWRAVRSRLWSLHRLKVFDVAGPNVVKYADLVRPGHVSIVDLSDTDSPELKNLVITDILRGVQEAQEERYAAAAKGGGEPPRTLVVIEEAHEFLSGERISRMPNLFQQVSRIAKRGRKRWLGLVFVTQHPQHLPDELFGLVNNYVLHRINDAGVISRLRRSIGGIDEGLWERLTALAPGQAVVSLTHMARPLLVAMDPTPSKLRMVE